jgi:hypothetical protein
MDLKACKSPNPKNKIKKPQDPQGHNKPNKQNIKQIEANSIYILKNQNQLETRGESIGAGI